MFKRTAKFYSLEPRRREDTKRIAAPKISQASSGTSKKAGPRSGTLFSSSASSSRNLLIKLATLPYYELSNMVKNCHFHQFSKSSHSLSISSFFKPFFSNNTSKSVLSSINASMILIDNNYNPNYIKILESE